jgi:streptomycin 6-kinase
MASVGGLDVPRRVRQRALSKGDAGARWLRELPDVLVALCATWGLQLGPAYRGGTAGYVVAARDATGLDVVVKVAMALDDERIVGFH